MPVINDGGPAFPCALNRRVDPDPPVASNVGVTVTERLPGMSLRDYFAGQALIGTQLVAAVLAHIAADHGRDLTFTSLQAAEAAYDLADAMIGAREKD